MRSKFELLLPAVLAVGLLVPLASLEGQLQSGQRVRVTAPDCGLDRQPATFQAFDNDTLVLGPMKCPLASVTHLDVHRGRKSAALLGAGIGFGVGTALVIALQSTPSACSPEPCDAGDWATAIYYVGGFGAGLGILVGLVFRSDRWEEVSLDRVSFAPQRDGRFGFGLSLRF